MGIPEIDYARAWREMLEAWALPAEVLARQPAQEEGSDSWQALALQFQRMTEEGLKGPPGPLISRVLEHVTPESTVLDVGAGTGRQTLRLAPHVQRVIAVEPSPAMRSFLVAEVEKRGLENVEVVAGRWPDIDVPVVDVVICANVLYDVQDIVPFVRALDAHARQACFIEITFRHPVARLNELWRLFWGIERPERPDYFDAVAVLHQMDIYANVQIEKMPSSFWYASLEEAVEALRRRLYLPADPQQLARLRAYVQAHSRMADGRVYFGPPTRRLVVLWWRKDTWTADHF